MKFRLAHFWPFMTPLLVLACGGSPSDGSQANDKAGFQPVPTLQPTESGPWVVDPGDPLTLYALGDRSLRSKDGGHSWSALGWPKGAQALLFSQQPVPALYLQVQEPASPTAALPPSRLLKSLNGGDSWAEVGRVAAGDVLSLIDLNSQPVLLTMRNDGVWRSTDDGATWVAAPLPMTSDLVPITVGRLLASSGSGLVYVEALAFNDANFQPTVFVSTDAGATFEPKAVPGNSPSRAPTLSLDCKGRLYLLDGSTVYRSSDAASTWQNLATLEPYVEEFRVAPGPPTECGDTVYAFGERTQEPRLWRLDPDGTVSTQAPDEYGVVLDLGRDRVLLVSAYQSVRKRSDDGGRSWWTAGVDLSGRLALSPAQQGLLFVASGHTVARSDDDGKSWTVAPAPQPQVTLEDVYPDTADPGVLYARTIFGHEFDSNAIPTPSSFISTDGGASFQNWPVPTAANPEVPQAIASSVSGTVRVVTPSGVYSTDDRGQHFATLLSLPHPKSILWAGIGASEPPSIYAYVSGETSAGHEVVVSLDGGATWSSSDPGIYVGCLVPHPADPAIAFACAGVSGDEGGPLRTLDGGSTWTRIATPEPAGSVQIDPLPPHALYARGAHLYRSLDQGDTWQPVSDFPNNAHSFELAAASPDGSRYLLTQSGLLEKWVE